MGDDMETIHVAEGSESLGAQLLKVRLLRGMTQRDLAAKLEITQQAVSAIEKDVMIPSVSTLLTFSNVLNVRIIIGGEELK